MTYIRNGWGLVRSQITSVIILFLYQLLWGVFLYRLIHSAVIALLTRYPEPPPNELSRVLYLIEGQFALGHSAEIHRYFWLLIGMAALRLLLTPFFQAGILYGLRTPEERGTGLPLFRGMKEFWKPVTLFFLLEMVLLALPALWVVPELYALLPRIVSAGGQLVPLLMACGYLLIWIAYGWLIRQILLFAQFGYLFKTSVWASLLISLRHIGPGLTISLLLGVFGTTLFLTFGTVSWIWTGLLALILQQAYPLIRSLFQIWAITSQYQLWQKKSQKS